MYRDEPKIKILTLSKQQENAESLIRHYSSNTNFINASAYLNNKIISNCNWDESFYKRLEVPFEHSWESFHVERKIDSEKKIYTELNPDNKEYAIIHASGSDGVNRIDYSKISKRLLLIETDRKISFFDYTLLIENAKEIHCVNSSFIHLVDRINTNGELFYHKNYKRRGNDIFTQRKRWNIFNDANYNKLKNKANRDAFNRINPDPKNVRFFKIKK